ncbi:sigma-54 dependent transcriptional regulator [Membranicola marinus]|uniref:Sigma-54 dependent transcriptional regulator n=1 Tax=Membranihabitans marinus TaxID=1227546 RepID=A0A953HLJ2_9BACT|nr:sigma-54 dependent transcriptional regulator [Membranihabitans marinus]MBY5957877.1 sigma-54 dependent transcriptional regulator [Membranihabitans marinus]
MARILIVDDEDAIRRTLKDILTYEKFKVEEAKDGMEGLAKIKKNSYDVVLMDIKMPNMDGMDALERLQDIQPDLPVIMISGHANIDNAVEAVKKGAFDFISKPPDLNRLLITVRNALEQGHLVHEKKNLQRKVNNAAIQDMIGQSAALEQVRDMVDKVAPTEARVLITGDNGTGKELVAGWIHAKSERSDKPLIAVNCAAIPAELIESELFGHEKGSFTTAVKQRIGKFEQANNGTLFLDEVGDMSLSAQAKVLRALEERRIMRVGGDKMIAVNVRVLAATNKDLAQEIRDGKFREDLFHRLQVINIKVPSLNDRREDIPELVAYFTEKICSNNGYPIKKFTKESIAMLQQHNWTGNIRELRNVVERLIILSSGNIDGAMVTKYVNPDAYSKPGIKDFINRFSSLEEATEYLERAYNQDSL